MSPLRQVAVWIAILTLTAGVGSVSATNRNGCLKFADAVINWFNGGTGDYFAIYTVAAAGTTDHINAYNGLYGSTGWLSLTQISSYSGCTVKSGRIQMNQTYLDNGSYTRLQKKAVACNLIGKLLGLTHQAGTAGCMDGTLNNPFPSAHDRDTINAIY
jgi:hypothetical protein